MNEHVQAFFATVDTDADLRAKVQASTSPAEVGLHKTSRINEQRGSLEVVLDNKNRRTMLLPMAAV